MVPEVYWSNAMQTQTEFSQHIQFINIVYQHSEDLIRRKIQPGNKSQTKYNVWIRIDIQNKNDPVKDYY